MLNFDELVMNFIMKLFKFSKQFYDELKNVFDDEINDEFYY